MKMAVTFLLEKPFFMLKPYLYTYVNSNVQKDLKDFMLTNQLTEMNHFLHKKALQPTLIEIVSKQDLIKQVCSGTKTLHYPESNILNYTNINKILLEKSNINLENLETLSTRLNSLQLDKFERYISTLNSKEKILQSIIDNGVQNLLNNMSCIHEINGKLVQKYVSNFCYDMGGQTYPVLVDFIKISTSMDSNLVSAVVIIFFSLKCDAYTILNLYTTLSDPLKMKFFLNKILDNTAKNAVSIYKSSPKIHSDAWYIVDYVKQNQNTFIKIGGTAVFFSAGLAGAYNLYFSIPNNIIIKQDAFTLFLDTLKVTGSIYAYKIGSTASSIILNLKSGIVSVCMESIFKDINMVLDEFLKLQKKLK